MPKMRVCVKCGVEKPASQVAWEGARKHVKGVCFECMSPEDAEREMARREKLCERRKKYREANREKVKAYREANREKARERQKAYHEANREKIRERQKAYREANRENLRERGLQYVAEAKDSYIAYLFKLPVKAVPKEIIELKRVQLQITREIRKQQEN